MLMNMFTIFDPMIFNFPWNYLFTITMMIFFIKMKFWHNKNNLYSMFNNMIIKEILINNHIMNKSLIIFFNNLFIIMFTINIMNLFPNMFYISSNIIFSMNLSFYFINNFFMFNLFNNKNIFMMNLTPKNTPIFLILLINMIELNSFFIQILTLSMRLMINMMLGHIIMFLINNIMLIQFYLLIELMIIIIQSYVFFILNLLNSNNMY